DFDNDGDLDLAVIGKDDSRIWRNEGYYFYNIWSGGRLAKSDLAWGDFDNDGDLDLALAGDQGNRDPRTIILENNVEEEWFGEYWNFNFISGNGNFEGVFDGNISWLDYDNDGDLDFVVAGLDKGNRSVLKIYNFEYNEENGNFDITEISTTLVPVSNGSFTWGDYDNDEDLDLAQIGYDGATGLVTRIYRNDGDQFTDTEINLPGVENGTIEFADYDNDGDLDIFLSGEADFSTITTILENKLDDIFINRLPNFIPVSESNASWGDYDSDGDLDLIYSGRSPGLGGITKIYTNDGNNIFSDISFDLSDFDDATMAWGDYDGDNDLDIVITGQASSGSGSIMQVYKNVISSTENVKLKGKGLKTAKAPSKNTPPSIPSGLRINPEINVTEEETTIQFLWDASTDDYTDSPGLTYALRIGTTPGGSEIMAANANTNGVRKLSGKGNVEHNLSWSISLESGTYFWVVQAIDAAYSGSAFSVQQSFTLNEGLVDINYAPTNIYLTDTTIIEWQSVETVIGTLSAFDPDDDDTHTFDFGIGDGSDDNASFTIDGNVLKSAQEFDFSVKNIYYIRLKVTDNGGLSYEKPFQIQILDATGLEDIRSSSGIKVFPNPITNTAIIQLNNSNNEIFRFRLINMQGEVIKEINNISGNEITFHKNELPHGFYLIELISENGEVYRIKVIIQ
ncbi:MAG: T9SS type A sorting domain-containing protein, partial [Bacteroidales bacterium]|nr:T9SS type A sorting domain-containing protein [Bacteroidales bacterium]